MTGSSYADICKSRNQSDILFAVGNRTHGVSVVTVFMYIVGTSGLGKTAVWAVGRGEMGELALLGSQSARYCVGHIRSS